MTKKHHLKFILPLAAVAMFASVSGAKAAAVIYNLTSDGGVVEGTLSFDSAVAPTSTDGGTGDKTYTHATLALPAFSFSRAGSTATFDLTDDVFELFLVTDASFTPLFLKIDIDDLGGSGDFFFTEGAGLDLTAGTGNLSGDVVGVGDVFGAALTAVPEPGSMALLGLSGFALFLRRRR